MRALRILSIGLLLFFGFTGKSAEKIVSICPGTEPGTAPLDDVPLDSLIIYPREARSHGIDTGIVSVDMLIGLDGFVERINLLQTSDTLFNAETIRVLETAHFSPATQNELALN